MMVNFTATHEEAEKRLTAAMKAADARVQWWQKRFESGDCFLMDSGEGLLIYGEVLETHEEERLRHYRFCRCYSVACPEGELGDVHVSAITCRISRGLFEKLRERGWPCDLSGLAEERPDASGAARGAPAGADAKARPRPKGR